VSNLDQIGDEEIDGLR